MLVFIPRLVVALFRFFWILKLNCKKVDKGKPEDLTLVAWFCFVIDSSLL